MFNVGGKRNKDNVLQRCPFSLDVCTQTTEEYRGGRVWCPNKSQPSHFNMEE